MTGSSDENYGQVVDVIRDYFDALHFCDLARLAKVFHPSALYACATEGKLLALSMEEYFPIVAKRISPASRKEARNDHIDSIEFAGPVTVFVRARCSIGPKFFTDFLTLVFIDGSWKIISKVFHFDLMEDARANQT